VKVSDLTAPDMKEDHPATIYLRGSRQAMTTPRPVSVLRWFASSSTIGAYS
jgi:hypothetical protein